MMLRWALLALPWIAAAAEPARAQRLPDTVVARPLATRAALEALVAARSADTAALARARWRLDRGDFQPGDLVLLDVRDEALLSDTFAVAQDLALHLPSPTVGALPLRGVLRSEVQHEVTTFLGQFLQHPVVRARPLLRLSVQGEVVRAGFHGVPADAVLAEALMAAGGTTARADMRRLRIERDGETVMEGRALQQALAAGVTLDEAYLRDGDQIVVERRGDGGLQEHLRFLWVVVSLAGGIYGLSRAF